VYHSIEQRDFVRKALEKHCGYISDFIMYKVGTPLWFLIVPDASHSGHTPFCPSFEYMTVALPDSDKRPEFRCFFLF